MILLAIFKSISIMTSIPKMQIKLLFSPPFLPTNYSLFFPCFSNVVFFTLWLRWGFANFSIFQAFAILF